MTAADQPRGVIGVGYAGHRLETLSARVAVRRGVHVVPVVDPAEQEIEGRVGGGGRVTAWPDDLRRPVISFAPRGWPWLSRLMARTAVPHAGGWPAGQLRQFAQAAAQNATDLAADARLLLDAGRFPRAHALATLALEELGKMELCHVMLAGGLDDKSFRQEWLNHPSKLDRSRILAILSAPTADRVFATVEDDSAIKFRGLYVDVNPADPGGAPMTPSDVGPVPAREMVETAEEAAALVLRSRSYGSRPAEGQAQHSGRV